MDYFNDPLFLRQIIMDHYENPRNKRIPDDLEGYRSEHATISSCIDDLMIYLYLDNGEIKDICFSGQACTISTASASIMTVLLKNKTIEEALKYIVEFDKMMQLEEFDKDLLQEANAFKNVGKQANRISCARLSWQGVLKMIKGAIKNDS